MAGLTKYEMETVVNYNAGEQSATVGLSAAAYIRLGEKVGNAFKDGAKLK